jgi:hypothetical protein
MKWRANQGRWHPAIELTRHRTIKDAHPDLSQPSTVPEGRRSAAR